MVGAFRDGGGVGPKKNPTTTYSVVVYVLLSMELCIAGPKHILHINISKYFWNYSRNCAIIFYSCKPIYEGGLFFVNCTSLCRII